MLFICIGHQGVCYGMCVETRGQLSGIISVLPPFGVQRFELTCQENLSTESSCHPLKTIFIGKTSLVI